LPVLPWAERESLCYCELPKALRSHTFFLFTRSAIEVRKEKTAEKRVWRAFLIASQLPLVFPANNMSDRSRRKRKSRNTVARYVMVITNSRYIHYRNTHSHRFHNFLSNSLATFTMLVMWRMRNQLRRS